MNLFLQQESGHTALIATPHYLGCIAIWSFTIVSNEVHHLLGPAPVKAKHVVVPDDTLVRVARSVETQPFELLHSTCLNLDFEM